MPQTRSRRQLSPLDAASLQALAVRYVGRYATTASKLGSYLNRKIAERGWAAEGRPAIDQVVERCIALGYVDDQAFAEAKSRTLARRGYGQRRIEAALNQSGIARDVTQALRMDEEAAFESARTFARKRRIGPFAAQPADRDLQRRQFAAMVRAGHSAQLAGYFVKTVPDADGGEEY